MREEHNIYGRNDTIRIVALEELDDKTRVYLMSFFRRIGLGHVYWERVLPTFQQGQSLIVAAMRDRPWPPWGSGAQNIHMVCHAYPKDAGSVYLSAIFVTNEHLTNIGLMSAVYKEMLQHLTERGRTNVNYVVREGSIFAHRVLVSNGFKRSEELYLTDEARYTIYQADASTLLEQLGLAAVSTEDLLEYKMNNAIFEKAALFQGMMQLATRVLPHVVLAKPDGGVPNGGS